MKNMKQYFPRSNPDTKTKKNPRTPLGLLVIRWSHYLADRLEVLNLFHTKTKIKL